MKKKTVKKPAKVKIDLKQGRYAAVLTLRILPEEIDTYNNLLKLFNKKNYSEAVQLAAGGIVKMDKELKETKQQLQEIGNKYMLSMRKLSLLVTSHAQAGEFIKKNAKDVPTYDNNELTAFCSSCRQSYIDDGYGCPNCD